MFPLKLFCSKFCKKQIKKGSTFAKTLITLAIVVVFCITWAFSTWCVWEFHRIYHDRNMETGCTPHDTEYFHISGVDIYDCNDNCSYKNIPICAMAGFLWVFLGLKNKK